MVSVGMTTASIPYVGWNTLHDKESARSPDTVSRPSVSSTRGDIVEIRGPFPLAAHSEAPVDGSTHTGVLRGPGPAGAVDVSLGVVPMRPLPPSLQ